MVNFMVCFRKLSECRKVNPTLHTCNSTGSFFTAIGVSEQTARDVEDIIGSTSIEDMEDVGIQDIEDCGISSVVARRIIRYTNFTHY